jgi:formate hydrogenlyase subunit 6/NADH:ubiquinone oxidoreductase subunit I
MDPVKIAGVADWPMPSNKKEVQSFVGFVNFYRCFFPGFSHHACALFDLTMKDVIEEALDRRREFEEGEEWLARQSHRTDIMLERIHRGQDDDSF